MMQVVNLLLWIQLSLQQESSLQKWKADVHAKKTGNGSWPRIFRRRSLTKLRERQKCIQRRATSRKKTSEVRYWPISCTERKRESRLSSRRGKDVKNCSTGEWGGGKRGSKHTARPEWGETERRFRLHAASSTRATNDRFFSSIKHSNSHLGFISNLILM